MSGEIVYGVFAFAILAYLLTTKFGWWGFALTLTITWFATFLVVFFTPLGGVIWPNSVQLVAQIGVWRWVVALVSLYVTIFMVAVAVNTETGTLDRLKRGYGLFHGLPWSEMGPITFLLAFTGVATDWWNQPKPEALVTLPTPPPGWEGLVIVALIIGSTAFILIRHWMRG